MDHQETRKILSQTFEDHKLSRSEYSALRQVLNDFSEDSEKLSFIRNQAFDIAESSLKHEHDKAVIKWLKELTKLLDNVRPVPAPSSKAFFSPGEDCMRELIRLINCSVSSIDACVFTITDNRISRALEKAFNRKVKIRIITDDDKSMDAGSDVDDLASIGLAVRTDDNPSHMHHKFAIFDGGTLANGSFNWTRSASDYNEENIIVTKEESLTRIFKKHFNLLWDRLR